MKKICISILCLFSPMQAVKRDAFVLQALGIIHAEVVGRLRRDAVAHYPITFTFCVEDQTFRGACGYTPHVFGVPSR